MKETVMSLVFPIRRGRILLGKKMLRIGKGFFTGFGGNIEPHESIEQCATRELKEETGGKINAGLIAKIEDLHYRGVLKIYYPKLFEKYGKLIVHVYVLHRWCGRFRKTEEMIPRYFPLTDIPWDAMRESEHYWLPAVLKGRQVEVDIAYDNSEVIENMTTIIRPR